jgi:Leucine-rich repeat (LRR) protein
MDRKELLKIILRAEKKCLKELNLSYKGITELPPEIGKLSNLTVLSLSLLIN